MTASLTVKTPKFTTPTQSFYCLSIMRSMNMYTCVKYCFLNRPLAIGARSVMYSVHLEKWCRTWVTSTMKGVTQRSKDVTDTQQPKPASSTVTLTWHASKDKVHNSGRGTSSTEFMNCVKVEVAVLVQGSPSLRSLMVSVDVKQH